MFNTPIVFILFNRPAAAKQVFEKIRLIKPGKLYVAADGPRPGRAGEAALCQASRALVQNGIDWQCDVEYKFEEANLGCGLGVFSAISWAFKKEERLIILEDDVVPALPFFGYCEDLLETYKDDPRIWVISGLNHFNGKKNLNDDSYFFSHYASIWGWATWKRCWKQNDIYMKRWPDFKRSGMRFSHMPQAEGEVRYKRLDALYENRIAKGGKLDAWGPQYSFPIWANSGVGIVPAENLVTNIGVEGTHSSLQTEVHHLVASEGYKIEKRPLFFQTNHLYDQTYFNLYCKRKSNSFMKKIFGKWS
jgi:hypothetical protein